MFESIHSFTGPGKEPKRNSLSAKVLLPSADMSYSLSSLKGGYIYIWDTRREYY